MNRGQERARPERQSAVRAALALPFVRSILAVIAWVVVGIAGFGLVLLAARFVGSLYGLLPASIVGVSPLVTLLLAGMLALIALSSKRLFIVKRLFAMIVVAWLIMTAVFILVHASPYDPIKLAIGKYASNPLIVQQDRHLFGLDKPLWRQYTDYLGNFLHGDLGYSIGTDTFGSPVSNLIKDELPQTLTLGGYALLLSLYIGLPIGLVSALKQNSLLDHGSQAIMVVLFAVPPFVLAPVCQLIFADQLHWLPVTGWNLPGEEVQDLVMPVVIFAVGIAGFLSKSFRSFMLEVLQQDYIRTARAKGLKERTIIYLHACKNTLLPLASIVGPLISFLVTGAFIIERAFGVPGIAGDTVSAVQENNGPLIEATTLLLALAVVVVNMLTDIFYAMVDPRVKL